MQVCNYEVVMTFSLEHLLFGLFVCFRPILPEITLGSWVLIRAFFALVLCCKFGFWGFNRIVVSYTPPEGDWSGCCFYFTSTLNGVPSTRTI